MVIKIVVRAVVTVSVAVAISVDVQTGGPMWTMSDLPRARLKALETSNCGTEVAGYYQFPGLKWATSWNYTMYTWDPTACARVCDENTRCIAFTTKKPRHGKLLCNYHYGLRHQKDHRAMSYMRCVKGFDCEDGFQFTHAGTWKGGAVQDSLEMESRAECRLACRENRGCVGFTHRITQTGNTFCTHFENEDNKDGPSRDMRANTYSKCAQFEAPPALEEPNQTAEDEQNQTADSTDVESEDPEPESKDE